MMSGSRPQDLFSPLALRLHETLRRALSHERGAQATGLVRNCMLGRGPKRKRAVGTDQSQPGKLVRFLRLLDHLGNAPWASTRFAANSDVLNRLTAAHLGLIVGAEKPDPALFGLIAGPDSKLERCENLIWITNRQQGKTTTMGRFIAALALQVQNGGTLACVYSTKLDRASELCKAAKDYIYWMQTPAGGHADWPAIEFIKNNERVFEVRSGPPGSPTATVCARPKNADACRGDAPAAAFFDEIAFTSADFWYKFALPLLQIRNRRFTCTTTPPPPKSFFDSFCDNVREANEGEDTFFFLLNHSLACTSCIEAGEPARCCHRLFLVPQWKSLFQFNSVGALMPKGRAADYAAEVFGVMKHDHNAFLPAKLVDACLRDRGRQTSAPLSTEPLTVWVGVDLAGHSKSEMGMCAIVGAAGQIAIIGCASVRVDACQIVELQMLVRVFIRRVRAHPWLKPDSILVPVIECNLNEVMALSLRVVFEASPPYYQPFVQSNFQKCISDGIGVWTTEDTKMASIQCVYQSLLEGQLVLADSMVVLGREAFDCRSKPPTADGLVILLRAQLTQFTHDDKGKITGKTADGGNDDLAMALLLAVYWRLCVMSHDLAVR